MQQGASAVGLQSFLVIEEEAKQLGAQVQLRKEQRLKEHRHTRRGHKQHGLRLHEIPANGGAPHGSWNCLQQQQISPTKSSSRATAT